jgi:t-SNARE complex subunit (syntaxin)
MLFRTPYASVPWGMIQSTMGYGNVGYTLRTKKRAARKTPGAGIDHGRLIRDTMAMRKKTNKYIIIIIIIIIIIFFSYTRLFRTN